MQTYPLVTAVIPVHNRLDLLRRLLITLEAQSVSAAHIVIVDNALVGGIPAEMRGNRTQVIEMGENAGFARAVNCGWRAAPTPWVAILNSDVELDPRWLERLVQHSEGAVFATGTILSAADPTRIDGTYDLVSRSGCAWRAGYDERADRLLPRMAPSCRISIAPATACLYRRDILEQLGGFEESFESYLEDVDFGLKCVASGASGVYVPDAIAWHWGSATLGRWNPRIVRLTARNQLRLVARHYDAALFRSSWWQIIVGQFLWGLVAARHGAGGAWIAGKWEGLRDFHLKGLPSILLRDYLDASEREIKARARGSFWRWYFRLTSHDSAHDSPPAEAV